MTMLSMPSVQAVTGTGVTDPKDTDAVALLVPHDADRSVIPPQKFQWLIKGSAGAGYLKTGSSSLTCVLYSYLNLLSTQRDAARIRPRLVRRLTSCDTALSQWDAYRASARAAALCLI